MNSKGDAINQKFSSLQFINVGDLHNEKQISMSQSLALKLID